MAAVNFKAGDVAKHLADLKATGNDKWWEGVIEFEDIKNPRKGPNGTYWSNIIYTSPEGLKAQLRLKITGEKHTGTIMPRRAEDVAALAAVVTAKNPAVVIRARQANKVAYQISEFKVPVKTESDGITVKLASDGTPDYPDASQRSDYYIIASLIDEAFSATMRGAVRLGNRILSALDELGRVKPSAAEFIAGVRARAEAPTDCAILNQEKVNAIKLAYPAVEDQKIILQNTLTVSNDKIVGLVQTYVSAESTKNAGKKLPAGLTRISIPFEDSGSTKIGIHDKSKAFTGPGGRPQFELGKVDGVPVNANNVHKYIQSGTTADGMVDMSICFSNMGISIPATFKIIVTKAPESRAVGLDDLYDDDEIVSIATTAAPAPAAGAGTSTGFTSDDLLRSLEAIGSAVGDGSD